MAESSSGALSDLEALSAFLRDAIAADFAIPAITESPRLVSHYARQNNRADDRAPRASCLRILGPA
jgi:hypothetical protein